MTRHWPSRHRPPRAAQRPHSPVRQLAWGRHPGSEALIGACILAPASQDGFLEDVEALCGDEARDRLLPAGVGLEGDHVGRYLAELTSDFQELVGRRGSEDRIAKAGRTTHEDRFVEDQFQAVMVGQVVVGGEPERSAVPGDDVPVSPGPFGKLDRSMRSFGIPRRPPHPVRTDRQATQRLRAYGLTS